MKIGSLLLTLIALSSCTESVLDPNELAKNGPPGNANTDLVFYNREVVNIGIGSYRSVHSVSTADGSFNIMTEHGFISAPPVGNTVVYIDDSLFDQHSIYTCDLTGSQKQFIVQDSLIESATLSPDGKLILYTVVYEDTRTSLTFSRIKLISLQNPSTVDIIAEDADPSVMPTFSPDGQYIAYAQLNPLGNDLLAVYRIGSGSSSTTLLDVGLTSFSIDLEFDWTSDSKSILCLSNLNSIQDIVLVDLSGNITQLNFTAGLPIFPVMSTNDQIAAVSYDLIYNTSDIYLYNGRSWDNITNTAAVTEVLPHFSADGKKLVFSSIAGSVDPFTQASIPTSDLIVYENGTFKTLDNGMIVRPLFGR